MASLMESRHRILLNTPHLETVSGSVAHFTTDMAAKLKELKVNFLPQQAGSGDPSPDNVRAISGWTGVNLYQIGDTGYPIEPIVGSSTSGGMTWTVDENGKVYFEGTPDQFTGVNIGYVDVNGDETLFLRFFGSVNNINTNKLALYDANGNVIITSFTDATIGVGADLSQYDGVKRVRVSAKRAANNVYTHVNFVAIVSAGSPAVPNQITVSWADLGTIYGGFIDVLRGELVQKWKMVDFSDVSWITTSQTSVFSGVLSDHELTNQINILSDSYKSVNATVTIAEMVDKTIKTHEANSTYVYCKDTDYTTASDFIAATTGRKIVYKLATPITYPLTPEIIKALKGINNVFSDAGDVELKYYKH